MEKASEQYSVKALISPIEARILHHLRSVMSHGFGSIQINVQAHRVINLPRTLTEDPEELRKLQPAEAEGGDDAHRPG